MTVLWSEDAAPKQLRTILLPGENMVVAAHSHWVVLIKPVALSVGALVLAVFIDLNQSSPATRAVDLLWWAWFASLGWVLWKVINWRHDWFFATNKRLIRRYGLFTTKVAQMPLIKVTDMSYNRSLAARLMGYGTFVMENAGQDQALRTVDWVPKSYEVHQAICREMFPDATSEPGIDDDGTGDGPTSRPPGSWRIKGPWRKALGRRAGTGGPRGGDSGSGGQGSGSDRGRYPDVPPMHNPVQDRLQGYSRPIPVRPVRGGEPLYESDDIRQRRRKADTGPVPMRPRHEPRTD